MQMLVGAIGSIFGGGGAAAGAATGAGVGGAAAGINIASILQGTATVLGVVSSIGAGNADAAAMEAQAVDAERENALETLSGIQRRGSIRRAMQDAIGAGEVAFASGGVDLSFGTAAKARNDSYREADLAITSDTGTEMTRSSRLMERAANYRAGAKRARRGGLLNGAIGGLAGAASIAERY